jgi:uncharacterized protein (UPF0297 family)
MIKYVILKDKNTIIGILENTRLDGINKINKIMGVDAGTSPFYVSHPKYLMPNAFKATVVCDPRDEWNVEEGKKLAKKKVLKNYYKSLDKRMDMFRDDLAKLNGKVFDEFIYKKFQNNT